METIKCPNCGSTDVIAEAKSIIRFRFNEYRNIEIISEWSDIVEQIQDKVAYNFECQDCNHIFGKLITKRYKGENLK